MLKKKTLGKLKVKGINLNPNKFTHTKQNSHEHLSSLVIF